MSFSRMRPRTLQLVELHVFYVPAEVWNFQLNTVPVALNSKFVSAGFIRVSPHVTLRVLREELGEYLGGVRVADKFKFLKCLGEKTSSGKLILFFFSALLCYNVNQRFNSLFRCLLNIIVISLENKMEEQLQQMKKDTRHMEKAREELIKKAKGLLEQNKLRRYHVPEEWRKKYFETKKATVSLEETWNKLRQDLELHHRKLLLDALMLHFKFCCCCFTQNYTIIRITTVQHELDQLKKKLDDAKMKLIIEIKMRKQAASDLRALRAELTPKIHSALILQSRRSGV
uniref:Spermatogenesis associated 1 n=1 Tax=Malurus cyaneus samueli TaxID=2593467 RepID=A0A8C5TXD0_9PASS